MLIPMLLLAVLASPVHISLEHSVPAADEVVAQPPGLLRLRFSGFIEPRYTGVTLTAPDGSDVALGPIAFVPGSDREFTAAVRGVMAPGEYSVRWRTAGADGHVLEGSYAFRVARADAVDPTRDAARDAAGDIAGDSARAGTPADPVSGAIGDPDAAAGAHEHGSATTSHEAGSPLNVTARLAHFAALLVLLGGLSFRAVLLPRLGVDSTRLRRVAWLAATLAAVALGLAAVLRLWLQSVALHGADRAWSTPLLSMMLTDTIWGRAWVLQAFLFTLLGAAIVWARPARDRIALCIAVPAAAGLAMIPALTGHAAAVDGPAYLIVANDTAHVMAGGLWLGTLAVLMVGALPVLIRDHGAATAARAIHEFSPVAIVGAATVMVTGAINALLHFSAPAQLIGTAYGRALLLKLALVALVLLAGFVNWRVLRPRLGMIDGLRRLRLAAASELAFAALVLLATAVLTGQPRP